MNGDGIYFSLPYIDQFGQPVVTPHWDARTGDYIVPSDYPNEQRPATTQAPSYETPWYVDSINRAIERAAQVATIEAGGYPPYPTFPGATPLPTPGDQPHREGIQLSQTTLMLIVGGVLLFMLGGKRGR